MKTPLFDQHLYLKAKMIDFSGWQMPVQYANVIEEHMATRNFAGLFDISHMGEFIVRGKDAKQFLQNVLTNDIEKLTPGNCFYSAICNEKGGTIDDLFVYMFKDHFMIVVNASRIDIDFTHFKENIRELDVKIENKSNEIAKIDIQGPKAREILNRVVDIDINRFTFTTTKYHDSVISRTGYTGEDGFEIYIDSSSAVEVWKELLKAGSGDGLKPCGLGARDTLRIEASYSLYGHELSETITPIEAGIGFVVSEKEFIGSDEVLKQKKEGVNRKVYCFEMAGRGIPRENYEVYTEKKAGYVTSGTFSPLFKKGIGLAMLESSLKVDDQIRIKVRGAFHDARIVKRPIYQYMGGKK